MDLAGFARVRWATSARGRARSRRGAPASATSSRCCRAVNLPERRMVLKALRFRGSAVEEATAWAVARDGASSVRAPRCSRGHRVPIPRARRARARAFPPFPILPPLGRFADPRLGFHHDASAEPSIAVLPAEDVSSFRRMPPPCGARQSVAPGIGSRHARAAILRAIFLLRPARRRAACGHKHARVARAVALAGAITRLNGKVRLGARPAHADRPLVQAPTRETQISPAPHRARRREPLASSPARSPIVPRRSGTATTRATA